MRSTAVAAAGVAAAVTLGQAQASTIFDSYVGGSYSDSGDSIANFVTGMAGSFNAAGQSFNRINLQISAPSGGTGSTMVYLVPDNGSSPGVPGHTNTIFSDSVTPSSFSTIYGSDRIATISDSSLGTTPSLYTLNIGSVPATSSNGEYWLVLIPTDGLQWSYATANNASYVESHGIGLANQSNVFYNVTTSDVSPFGWNTTSDINDVASGSNGPYAFQVLNTSATNTPEPASAAILGSALVGAGVLRRRVRRNAV